MSLYFRPIHPNEIPDLCRLVDSAYSAQVKSLFGNSTQGRWVHYDEAKVTSFYEREPEGVRIGIRQGQMVTVCICRSFGTLGWFHTLGVHRDFQGKGFGHKAVIDAQRYLAGRGVSDIGLMTWPVSLANIGFYQDLGYRSVGLSVHGYRHTQQALQTGQSPLEVVRLSTLGNYARKQALSAIAELTHSMLAGLDYTPWLTWALDRAFGDVLAFGKADRLVAFVLAYTQPRMDWLEGKLLMISPDCGLEEQSWVFEHLRRWAASLGRTSFGFPIDLMDSKFALQIQKNEFRLFGQSMLNMVKGKNWPPQGIHLVRFSG